MNRIQKNKTELLILSVLSICIMMLQYFQIHGQAIFFLDNDDYIRVQRIREFFTHHDWNNSIIIRGNYPYGISLHWTRFYDLFLIIPSYLLSFFTQSIDRSLEYVCFWISPILRVISSVIVLKIATNIMPKKSAFLTAVLFTSIPFISGYFAFGRPDHHAFMVLWILIYISSLIELISQQKFPSIISHLKTATTAAICIWISPETLITILASLGCLFFCAFNNIQRLKTLYLISLITSLFVGLIAFIPEQASNTSFLLLICSLWTLAPYTLSKQEGFRCKYLRYWHYVCVLFILLFFSRVNPIEYDKISTVHSTLFFCIATFFAINMQYAGKPNHKTMAMIWTLVIGSIYLFMYPLFLHGMEGELSPYAKQIWFSKVSELQSPLTNDNIRSTFLASTIISIAAIVIKVINLRKTHALSWQVIITCASVFVILSCFAHRLWPYASVFSLPIIVSICLDHSILSSCHRWLKIILAVFCTILFIYPIALLKENQINSQQNKYRRLNLKSACRFIDTLSESPVVIMENCNLGAKILYYTKHRVLAVPYHRSTQGIISTHDCLNKSYDESAVKKILSDTNTEFIIVSKNQETKNDSLASRILNGNHPNYLTPMNVPESCESITVMKVNINKKD